MLIFLHSYVLSIKCPLILGQYLHFMHCSTLGEAYYQILTSDLIPFLWLYVINEGRLHGHIFLDILIQSMDDL